VLAAHQLLLLFDLCLLLFYRVDEDGRELVVSDAFDLALLLRKVSSGSTFSTCERKTGDWK